MFYIHNLGADFAYKSHSSNKQGVFFGPLRGKQHEISTVVNASPQQNDMAERNNRHLVEICQSMLRAKNMYQANYGSGV